MTTTRRIVTALVVLAALLLGACGSPGPNDERATAPDDSTSSGGTVRLLTHDSFNVSDAVLQQFEQQTGITVEIVKGGDAVEVVNKAVLTKDDPQGDVLFGVDNNILGRALDENLFESYTSPGLATVDPALRLDDQDRVTPIDLADVCVNFDREALAASGTPVPTSLADLASPAYKNELVVENPTTSTPGLAFLLATRAALGDGWLDYWRQLKANGVTVADGWEQAYYDRFSGGSGQGDRPLVVSYATSPPAEVTDPTVPPDQAPTGVIPSTCYRQIEFAGILSGTPHRRQAEQLVDFLLSRSFQEDVPGSMYVWPANRDAAVPDSFVRYSVKVDQPLQLPVDDVAANRDAWVDEWAQVFGS